MPWVLRFEPGSAGRDVTLPPPPLYKVLIFIHMKQCSLQHCKAFKSSVNIPNVNFQSILNSTKRPTFQSSTRPCFQWSTRAAFPARRGSSTATFTRWGRSTPASPSTSSTKSSAASTSRSSEADTCWQPWCLSPHRPLQKTKLEKISGQLLLGFKFVMTI